MIRGNLSGCDDDDDKPIVCGEISLVGMGENDLWKVDRESSSVSSYSKDVAK